MKPLISQGFQGVHLFHLHNMVRVFLQNFFEKLSKINGSQAFRQRYLHELIIPREIIGLFEIQTHYLFQAICNMQFHSLLMGRQHYHNLTHCVIIAKDGNC